MKQALLRVAEMITGAGLHPVPIQDDQAALLDQVVDADLIRIEDRHVSFANKTLLVTWVGRYWAIKISDTWQDPDNTVYALRSADQLRRILGMDKSFWTHLFSWLETKCACNVLSRLEEVSCLEVGPGETNQMLNALYFPFCQALPQLDYPPNALADQLGPVLRATEGYLPHGLLHEAIVDLASRSQQEAEALTRAFLAKPDHLSSELAANTLKILWDFDADKAHKQAIDLTKEKLPSLQRVGAIALGLLNYSISLHKQQLVRAIDCLKQLSSSGGSELLPAVTAALGKLLHAVSGDSDQLERIRHEVLRLSTSKEPAVQSNIAWILSRQSDDSGNTDWYWNVLDRLSHAAIENKSIMDRLDWIIYLMVANYPDRVIEHLTRAVLGREDEIPRDKNHRWPSAYKNTVIRLIESHLTKLEDILTRWFASRDERLHSAAGDIVSQFVYETRREPANRIRLNNSVLEELDESNLQRVIYALVGYVEDYDALASLLVSVLSRMDASECVRGLVADALAKVVLYNKPGVKEGYLTSILEDEATPGHVLEVVSEALEHSDSYYNALREIPKLKELMPPDARAHRFLAEQQKLMNQILEKDYNSETGFLGLIPVVPVKCGRASFSSEHGNVASSIPMRTVRTQIEIQRESVIDPVGRALMRLNWRRMAVEGVLIESQAPPMGNPEGTNGNSEGPAE